MSPRNEPDRQDEIVRLLTTQIRLSVGSQAAAIKELDKAGLGPTRIAELLGTTVGTVKQALIRDRRRRDRQATEPEGRPDE
jgi:DNA-directed RNA polymerase specialized sigma24 family protein